jgi:hypothetical protein
MEYMSEVSVSYHGGTGIATEEAFPKILVVRKTGTTGYIL